MPGKKAITRKNLNGDLARFDHFISFFENMKFPDATRALPSHKGWILALNSLKALSLELLSPPHNLSFLCLRKCNQDKVENLHCQIRQFNRMNDHPDVIGYTNALRCLAISYSPIEFVWQSHESNCEEDHIPNCPLPPSVLNPDNKDDIDSTPTPPAMQASDDDENGPALSAIEENIVQYIAGFVIRDLKKKKMCAGCLALCLTDSTQPSQGSHRLCELRDYKAGALLRVSSQVHDLLCSFEEHFRRTTRSGLPLPHPRAIILKSFPVETFIQPLNCHRNHGHQLMDAILTCYTNCRVFHFVKLENLDLRKKIKGNELSKSKKLNM